ncbi:hypothetical protein ASPCAL01202 [Aspergillus calidoustus]|uniref:Sld7 C-terminal domain-containing protein n=1 Tax=Aspergillus calidoustus TaxID=454130 RepID=A0A0U5FQZ8_ASPCI|nr:hypothetical protein ASPCAL01202 [Aspergillus calidoustus]
MDIWSGAISLDAQTQLTDLQFIDRTTSGQLDILRHSTLAFRNFVNPALIPLYARVGPNLELHTNDPRTSRWLKHKLLANIWLEDEDLDRFQTIQCPVGFLVSLDGAIRPRSTGPTATDLLVYGILSTTTLYERPPTPPVSSSPALEDPLYSIARQELRIYATPISGTLIARAAALPCQDDAGALAGHEQFAHFLPDLHSPSPKRKRVASLFESVAQHHKRVRHKGGEAVSQLMAQSLSQSPQQLQNLKVKRESEEPSLPILSKVASHQSRSLLISSNLNPNKILDARTEHPRPSSNRGHAREFASKKCTPAPARLMETSTQGGSVFSPAPLSSEGHEASTKPKDADTILSDNKNTITRTILTCMRLYGYNRSTRPLSSHNPPSHTDVDTPGGEVKEGDNAALHSSSNTDEDEFKAMYHATYRASTFALRKYLKEPAMSADGSRSIPPALEKAKAMTYIDGFLKLFCEEEH